MKMFLLSGSMTDTSKTLLGWILIAVASLNIFINITITIYSSFSDWMLTRQKARILRKKMVLWDQINLNRVDLVSKIGDKSLKGFDKTEKVRNAIEFAKWWAP